MLALSKYQESMLIIHEVGKSPLENLTKTKKSICTVDAFLTMTLRLGAQPGPISLASSLWGPFQHISRLTAEIDDAACCKLLS